MNDDTRKFLVFAFFAAAFFLWLRSRRPPKLSNTAHGVARFATDATLKASGYLAGKGLVIGRTLSGALIRLPLYTHTLIVGGTGSGKGVSFVIPNMLDYRKGSVVCLDVKREIEASTANHRGGKIVRLAPFSTNSDQFNVLDCIPKESPMLIDSARSVASALVVRTGMEHDPHWNDSAVDLICAILVLILVRLEGKDRSLNTLLKIVSSPKLIDATADTLEEMGGIPATLGARIKTLFDVSPKGADGKEGPLSLSKEGSSVVSTACRHLSFLSSELVSKAVSQSTFNPYDLLQPGTTVYIQIPPDQLEAQKGLLRCWTSALMRVIGVTGNGNEVLFMIDEASSLDGLSSLEEALVRGRSGGVRMCLIYQSTSQVEAAFKDKKTLIYDNCDVHAYLKPASTETAERISKSLGSYTEHISSYNTNRGQSYQEKAQEPQGLNHSWGSGESRSVLSRNLMRPEELLTMPPSCMVVLCRDVLPIYCRRILWFQDSAFSRGKIGGRSKARGYMPPLWYILVLMGLGLLLWAFFNP